MVKNSFFTLVVIMLFVAVITLTVREALASSAIALDPEASEAERLERSRMADTARWTAMGEYYEKLNEFRAWNAAAPLTSHAGRRWESTTRIWKQRSFNAVERLTRHAGLQ